MLAQLDEILKTRSPHPWLHQIHVATTEPFINQTIARISEALLESFRHHGHVVQDVPDGETDLLITSAPFNQPLDWRDAPLFNMRRRFGIEQRPQVLTLMHAEPNQFHSLLDTFRSALEKKPPDPADFNFPGMAPTAYRVLIEQGLRGGPIMALERLLQSQSKSIRILLTIGTDSPEEAYLFDLVGAHPRIPYDPPDRFYSDVVLRTVTAVSSTEVTDHQVSDQPITRGQWKRSAIPQAMQRASLELGKRNFFTPMVRIADLVQVPALDDAIASQYSEGCFATWEPELSSLVATVTGSARPVDKGKIGDDDLAVIVDVQPDGSGAIVRHVIGERNDPPSSEAVEMIAVDRVLPQISLADDWEIPAQVPVIRSKLHGHRGIASYNPAHVEHAPLDPAYYHYPVSCATDAQARAIETAFARAQTLQDPSDPREIVFTILPGHGVFIAEKWVIRKAPFQVIWESMDSGMLEIENLIPQGSLAYVAEQEGRMILQTP